MIAAHSHPSGWLCAAPSPCALNRRLHPPAKSSPNRVGISYPTGNLKKHLTTMLELLYDSRSYPIHTFCSPTGPRHSPTDEGLSKCGASAPIPALLRSILPRCAYWLTVPTATSYRSSCHVRSGWRRRVWYIDYRHCRHGWGQPSLYLHVGEAFCAGTTGGVGRQTRTWPPARAAPASLDGAARRVRMTCLSLEGGAQLRVT